MLVQTTRTFGPLFQFSDPLDRLFSRFGNSECDSLLTGSQDGVAWLPAVDVIAGEKEIVVRAEVPGVNPDNIEVTVTGRVLTIAGEKQAGAQDNQERVHHAERCFGSFRRVIKLPTDVDKESITASHVNGVLEIRLNKSQSVIPKRIQVKVANN